MLVATRLSEPGQSSRALFPMASSRQAYLHEWFERERDHADRLSMSLKRRRPSVLVATSIVLIVAIYAWRLFLLQTRTFDADEFEHLHAAFAIHQGLLPYRDFFEHHM